MNRDIGRVLLSGRRALCVAQSVFRHDDVEEPLLDECVVGRFVLGESTHGRDEVLQHGIIRAVLVLADELFETGQRLLASHLPQEHPKDPASLVVGHRRIAILRAVDLDERPLRVLASTSFVAIFDAFEKFDSSASSLHLIKEQGGGEMGHPLGENVAAWSFSRSQYVSPPLVGRLMSRHQKGDVRLRVATSQETDPLRKGDVGRKALRVRGKTREFA